MNTASSQLIAPVDGPETETPSWDSMVHDHGERVFRLAYRLTGNRQDAEDLSQEAFVRAFNALEKYTPGTMGGWLHRITTNLFLDQARRKSKIRFDRFAEGAEDRLPSNAVTPERDFEFNNLDVDVAKALKALAPDFRAAIVLCDMEGFSYEEVSQILNVKLGTVRSRIHRGRAMLRDALAHRNPANRAPLTVSLPRIPLGLRTAKQG
ncbi:RNA polymerase sigma factor SigE [Glutamicibacter sp. AOP38-B1-38]|uniref:RNA polymerase sigma factor SigE n=1 Tax=Glutamicibacter sp. AOP38-B1-38 TaxID=3457680 RepID=UPI004034273B